MARSDLRIRNRLERDAGTGGGRRLMHTLLILFSHSVVFACIPLKLPQHLQESVLEGFKGIVLSTDEVLDHQDHFHSVNLKPGPFLRNNVTGMAKYGFGL